MHLGGFLGGLYFLEGIALGAGSSLQVLAASSLLYSLHLQQAMHGGLFSTRHLSSEGFLEVIPMRGKDTSSNATLSPWYLKRWLTIKHALPLCRM